MAVAAATWLGVVPAALGQPSPSPSPSPSSSPQDRLGVRGPRDQVVLSGTVTVRRGEEVGEVVVLHGTVDVAGVVRGDVVVLDGRVIVTGQVSGTVVNVDGGVTLGPNAHVLGDVVARDRIRVAEGAIVGGRIREGAAFLLRTPVDVFGPFATWLAVAISTLILAALLLFVAPRGAEAVAAVTRSAPWASLGLGLAVAVGIPIVGVLAIVTIVGLPFGLALLLATWFLASIGFATSVFAVGRLLWRTPRSRWLALLFGWLAVSAVSAIPFVGGVVWAIGAVVGLGAIVVAIRRSRRVTLTEDRPAGGAGRHRAGARSVTVREPAPVVAAAGDEEEDGR